MPELISSRSNPLVKQVRALRQKKGRDETGQFLVEGIHHVGEAVQGGWEIETLVYSPDQLTSDFARGLVDEQTRKGVRLAALTRDLFADIAEKDNPQGLLAVIRQRHLTLENVTQGNFSFCAAVVSPQDAGNLGTILRTLDAVGGECLFLLDGGVELYHPSVVRASMGTLFWKPVVEAGFDEFVSWARRNKYQMVGSSAHAAIDYRDFKQGEQPVVLLLGNEQKGLSQGQIAACDTVVSMPMKGRVSSLNLAVAAGILLYTLMDARKG
jgi:TrmH family RNA methyltransferase